MADRRRRVEPQRSTPEALDPLDPRHRWDRPLQAPGHMQVDFEERVDFRRLHAYRLARTRQALARSGLGALLVFDQYNIRYISSTVIGEWARDKLIRWSLLTGNGEPWVWDFGSAARHHRLYAPWIPERQSLAGMVGMRGAVSPKAGLFARAAQEIKGILAAEGVAGMPLGVDLVEPPFLFALQEAGLEVRDGQQVMLEARMLKSQDELTLLNMAAAMVDGVYQDIFEALKPGGVLVYATCTFAPEENEGVIHWALERYGAVMTLEPFPLGCTNVLPGLRRWGETTFHASLTHARRILPTDDMEGFFIARLKKQPLGIPPGAVP